MYCANIRNCLVGYCDRTHFKQLQNNCKRDSPIPDCSIWQILTYFLHFADDKHEKQSSFGFLETVMEFENVVLNNLFEF